MPVSLGVEGTALGAPPAHPPFPLPCHSCWHPADVWHALAPYQAHAVLMVGPSLLRGASSACRGYRVEGEGGSACRGYRVEAERGRSHTGHTLATLWPHTGHTQATHRSRTGHTQVTLRSHRGHTQVTHRSHTGHTQATCGSHTDHMWVTHRSHTGHTLATHRPAAPEPLVRGEEQSVAWHLTRHGRGHAPREPLHPLRGQAAAQAVQHAAVRAVHSLHPTLQNSRWQGGWGAGGGVAGWWCIRHCRGVGGRGVRGWWGGVWLVVHPTLQDSRRQGGEGLVGGWLAGGTSDTAGE